MKKLRLIVLVIATALAFSSIALAGPDPYLLGQETYLVQKVPQEGAAPWRIKMPDKTEKNVAFGKLEYFNYGETFSFDFKGYDFGTEQVGDEGMPVDTEYALIYYVDPGPGTWSVAPDVYVLGISSGTYSRPAKSKGKAKGLGGVSFKISGSCPIAQIPVENDVSYGNGGKIWLVPAAYLSEPATCAWTTMTGWGMDILFETSLITYGFECTPE